MMRTTQTGFEWIESRLKHQVWLMYRVLWRTAKYHAKNCMKLFAQYLDNAHQDLLSPRRLKVFRLLWSPKFSVLFVWEAGVHWG
jgi:hypothetical protein